MLHEYIVSPNRYVRVRLSSWSSLHHSNSKIPGDIYESHSFYCVVFKTVGFLQPP